MAGSLKHDFTGQIISELTVIKRIANIGNDTGWLCKCSCGKDYMARGGRLGFGKFKDRFVSCGCKRTEFISKQKTIHGNKSKVNRSHEYTVWVNMKQRCYNPNVEAYKNYGGRGITVCERWRNSFQNFLEDMGRAPPGKTIDRMDNSKPYYKSNCKWSSDTEQARNKRNIKFTSGQIISIRQERTKGKLLRVLASHYDTSIGHISGICNDPNLWKVNRFHFVLRRSNYGYQ